MAYNVWGSYNDFGGVGIEEPTPTQAGWNVWGSYNTWGQSDSPQYVQVSETITFVSSINGQVSETLQLYWSVTKAPMQYNSAYKVACYPAVEKVYI